MPWGTYIESLKNSSVSSAIITHEGADCAHLGDWKASNAETIKIARLLRECHDCGTHFNYGNEDFKIVNSNDDVIIAHNGDNGLLFSKSKKLTVVVEYSFKKNSELVESELSSKVNPIIQKLKILGY